MAEPERVSLDVLPYFTADGLLPPGDYALTLDQLRRSHLVTGEGNPSKSWDKAWRGLLVDNLAILVGQLVAVGITEIFVDGSFVENKDLPHDIDGYFECDLVEFSTGEMQRLLNELDPFKVWTWDERHRRPAPNSAKWQLPMWHRYRVELYPHFPGLMSGIVDEFGNNQQFPAAFRKSRAAHRPKGIVQIVV